MKINRIKITLAVLAAVMLTGALSPVNVSASTAKSTIYRFYHYKSGSHFYTTSNTEKERVISTMSGIYRYEGSKFYGWKDGNSPHRVPVQRFYKKTTKTHFYTISSTETARLKKDGNFRYEGVAYYGQNDINDSAEISDDEFYGQCPLWRFYNFTNGTHFYTASLSEAARVDGDMSHKYRNEDVSYYVWSYNCLYDYL